MGRLLTPLLLLLVAFYPQVYVVTCTSGQSGSQSAANDALKPLDGKCFDTTHRPEWWSYRWCYKQSVNQFHLNREKNKIEDQHYLGSFMPEDSDGKHQRFATTKPECVTEAGLTKTRIVDVNIKCCPAKVVNAYRRLNNKYEQTYKTFIQNVLEPEACLYWIEVCSELACQSQTREKDTSVKSTIAEMFSGMKRSMGAAGEDSGTAVKGLYMQPKPKPPPGSSLSFMSYDKQKELRERTRSMFTFAYDSYLLHGVPEGELKPLSCSGGHFDPIKMPLITLIDTLDTLVIMGNYSEFRRAVALISSHFRNFDLDVNISVFETTIRILGGLLSAHMMAVDPSLGIYKYVNSTYYKVDGLEMDRFPLLKPQAAYQLNLSRVDNMQYMAELGYTVITGDNGDSIAIEASSDPTWSTNWHEGYDNWLLTLAIDIGERMLPAFNTKTGIPYGTVNLRHGVPKKETEIASTAGAGSLLLEFEVLSRLTGDKKFGEAAHRATKALFESRSPIGLFGKHINIRTGKWHESASGIGSNSDSFYEYLSKAYFLFRQEEYHVMFTHAYNAIKEFVVTGDWFADVDMYSGKNRRNRVESLHGFWPGLEANLGFLDISARQLNAFYSVWNDLGFFPEEFDQAAWLEGKAKLSNSNYPLRPELIESTYHHYVCTKDRSWLHAAERFLESLEKLTRTECGHTSIGDMQKYTQMDDMPSFFLSETLKYLYLLFDEDNFMHDRAYVLNTEAHPFDPLQLPLQHDVEYIPSLNYNGSVGAERLGHCSYDDGDCDASLPSSPSREHSRNLQKSDAKTSKLHSMTASISKLNSNSQFSFPEYVVDDIEDLKCLKAPWWHLPSVRYEPEIFASFGKGAKVTHNAKKLKKMELDGYATALIYAGSSVGKLSILAQKTEAAYLNYLASSPSASGYAGSAREGLRGPFAAGSGDALNAHAGVGQLGSGLGFSTFGTSSFGNAQPTRERSADKCYPDDDLSSMADDDVQVLNAAPGEQTVDVNLGPLGDFKIQIFQDGFAVHSKESGDTLEISNVGENVVFVLAYDVNSTAPTKTSIGDSQGITYTCSVGLVNEHGEKVQFSESQLKSSSSQRNRDASFKGNEDMNSRSKAGSGGGEDDLLKFSGVWQRSCAVPAFGPVHVTPTYGELISPPDNDPEICSSDLHISSSRASYSTIDSVTDSVSDSLNSMFHILKEWVGGSSPSSEDVPAEAEIQPREEGSEAAEDVNDGGDDAATGGDSDGGKTHQKGPLSGGIVVAMRGNCMFEEKAIYSQAAGAKGVIVANNEDYIFIMSGRAGTGRRLLGLPATAEGHTQQQSEASSSKEPLKPDMADALGEDYGNIDADDPDAYDEKTESSTNTNQETAGGSDGAQIPTVMMTRSESEEMFELAKIYEKQQRKRIHVEINTSVQPQVLDQDLLGYTEYPKVRMSHNLITVLGKGPWGSILTANKKKEWQLFILPSSDLSNPHIAPVTIWAVGNMPVSMAMAYSTNPVERYALDSAKVCPAFLSYDGNRLSINESE